MSGPYIKKERQQFGQFWGWNFGWKKIYSATIMRV